MNLKNIAKYDRCTTCRRIHDKEKEHDCNLDHPVIVGDGFSVTLSQEYAKPEDKMRCFVCMIELESSFHEDETFKGEKITCQPSYALCFSGDGHYGSLMDREAREEGFKSFEIFICDKCFDTRKSMAVGHK